MAMEARHQDPDTDLPAYSAMAILTLVVALSIATYLLLSAR
jgi:hypothetical protein